MPQPHTGKELTAADILHSEAIDLSSDEHLGDDALEQLIKSKEEVEIFNNLPLFDVAIIHNFIDEWFATPNISFEDLQLPVGLSVAFQGAIASELSIAQRIVELEEKIDHEKAQFKKHMAKLSVQEVKSFKVIMHEVKENFLKKRAEAQDSRERMKSLADRCVQAYNEAEKRKALGRPGIDPRMAAKKKKKPAMAGPEAPRQEAVPNVFPTATTGSKPKSRSTASELKKTRTAEAEARKRKHTEASPSAPTQKKRKIKKARAAPTEPLMVEPLSVVHPNAERQLTVHEPASTEALEAEDIPAADPIAAEDIGHQDNVQDDAALPQYEHSELINIGRPLTPIAQDASWADHPQEEEDFEAQPTPTPQASSAFRRLRKGPRPQVYAEDIPAASAEENEEVPQDPTPPLHHEAVLQENVPKSDPPASRVEAENIEAATTNTEANVEPSPPKASEDSEATDPDTSVPESAAGPQFDYHIEHRPHVQKPVPRLPRFPGPASAPGSFNINSFKADNTFFNSSKNPYSRERIS